VPRWISPLIVLALAALAPAFATTAHTQTLLTLGVVYALNVLGMHVIFGLTGILSIAQAAFWGIGAYTAAILTVDLGVPFLAGFAAAILVAALAGIVLGAPTLRLKTHYLVLATIAFAEVTRQVLTNWATLTRGPQGMPGIPRAEIFGFVFTTRIENYYLGLAVLTLVVLGLVALRTSRLGRAMEAVRDDPLAAEAMGINVTYIRILAFSLSAALGGMAGSLYVHVRQFVSPDSFDLHAAVFFLLILLIGGRRSITGCLVAAFLITYLPEWLRPLQEWDMTIYGAGLLLILVFASEGLAGTTAALWRRLRSRRRPVAAVAGGGEQ
jgi:branched-chain amino acid transport system permease protein